MFYETVLTHAGPSLPPMNVGVIKLSSSFVLLEWDSPPEHSVNGVLRSYHLILTDNMTGKSLQETVKSPPHLFNSLQPFSDYTVIVAAVTVDIGPFSHPLNITTLEYCKMKTLPVKLIAKYGQAVKLGVAWLCHAGHTPYNYIIHNAPFNF